ncbi:MAG TPA: hypothetical protein VJ894_03510 [Cryomorphaceae bacterium]|nr:hypothetical protein [Cryomorphaceae bacterium]
MGSASEKIRTVLGLVMVILLVFITNRLDQEHFEEVQGTITTIYEDRVVAQYDLFLLTNLIHGVQMRMNSGDTVSLDSSGELERVLTEYGQTTLTKRENEIFGRLNENLNKLRTPEIIPGGSNTKTTFERIHQNLEELSEIQVKESKSLKIQAQDSLDSSNLMSNMEMILIIIFGVVLQFVLFSGGKRKVKE